jgi:thiamine pyrophosphate-dependent acetolactate synthase large subunit-like protein
MTEENIQLGEREFYPNPSMLIAEELVDHGVEIAFGVHGGHIWPICDEMSRHGIQLITVRHEQNAVYMAENFAKITRKPAVVFGTAGPGMTNMVSAVNQCYLSKTPLIMIFGSHEVEHDGLYSTIQEAYASDLLGGVTKWTQRIVQSNQTKQCIARAFRDAMTYPYAPVALEFSCSMLSFNPIPPAQRFWEPGAPNADHVPMWRGEKMGQAFTSAGDPELIEKAVEAIFKAKNPLIMAGDGIHWSDASKELIEFAEYAKIPVSGRRLGRGAVPETHDLAVSSKGVSTVKNEVDLHILIGMKVGFFDGYGRGWKRVTQINESSEHIWTYMPTEISIIGTPKIVIKQMMEYARFKGLTPPAERDAWLARLKENNVKFRASYHERALKYKDLKPLHPGYIAKIVSDVCESRYNGHNHIVVDGFTISGFAPQMLTLRSSSQITDSSEQAGVGHGVGMAIGVAFADSSTKKCPVVALMGDAGMGNAGMEIETAVRYKLPIVFLVTNNDGWLSALEGFAYGKNFKALKNEKNQEWGVTDFIPDQRYDKMFEAIGCHGEWVTEPSALKDALERCFDAAENGIPSVLNIKTNRRVLATVMYTTPVYASGFNHIPYDELPKIGKSMRFKYFSSLYPKIPQMEPRDPWEPLSDEDMEP